MDLSAALLKLLVCPVTGNSLVYDRKARLLINKKDGLAYQIVDGIPILLASEAQKT
jgi:uncharacterized protein YbaR (Trm112 family)